MSTRIRSFSKINLGLAIGPLWPDGFHALTTLYQTLDACDLITVDARSVPGGKGSITLTTNDKRVPTDARNTVWKMLARATESLSAEIHVHIEKCLPIQGGLGAGSANAVAALIGLERELGWRLPGSDRLRMAAEVGSDVPLFLIGGAVLGLSRGEEVFPMPDLPETHCVVALPTVGVSTPQAFRDWDALVAQRLTANHQSDRLKELSRVLSACLSGPYVSGVFSEGEGLPEDLLLALVRTGIENDFEEVVFRQNPLFGEIKRILKSSGNAERAAIYAALSGSGSAVFGLYRTVESARAAEERLSAYGIASLRTKTLPREAYWATMIVGS